jgi:uncharacterized protein with NAD-binding domain and iron-sulfur cluster
MAWRCVGYTAIHHLDFIQWLRIHGASEMACSSPLVRGMYDLVFGYEGGDRRRPQFAAGTAISLVTRMFFSYRGAIFWKMRAGMGDVVFARCTRRSPGAGSASSSSTDTEQPTITSVALERQIPLAPHLDRYQPLVRVAGLPCFPDQPMLDQLGVGAELLGHDLESHWVRLARWHRGSARSR